MTNEEAIEYLKWIRPKKPWSLDKKNTQIAIDKAIKALEQQTNDVWIPVSEGLPESLMVKTLVSCEDVDGLPISTMVAIYDAFSKTWNCEDKVIAWRSLPEPYKTESEE